jgi:hypothetical protein
LYLATMTADDAKTEPEPAAGDGLGAAGVTREQAAANALASVRAEGLDPRVAEPLLERWARGEISDEQLNEGVLRIAAGEPLGNLLDPGHA